MSNWAERVHRRAANFGSVVNFCGHPGSSQSFPYRMEKVKFGIPLEEVCKNNNIPGPLLVLILKLNKESPNRRDVFRAPGHQGAMKKLIHFLQSGRLVNVDKYSVYTIASVLKKFLRKIPNGIFGREGEKELFEIIGLDSETEQTERLHRLFTSLPKYTQHLLVLLFGTFRVIASNSAHANTGMTSEALGVSVAPSFFQSCVSDGKTARMEDVLRFKVATRIIKDIIDKFATHDLFGRENYEYYARVTGRILKVQDEWICSFQYPPPPRGKIAQQRYALQHSLEAEKTWLQCQCERWLLIAQEESHSTPVLLSSSSSALDNSLLSLSITPEHSFLESSARLSVSLEGSGLFAMTSSLTPKRRNQGESLLLQRYRSQHQQYDDEEAAAAAAAAEIAAPAAATSSSSTGAAATNNHVNSNIDESDGHYYDEVAFPTVATAASASAGCDLRNARLDELPPKAKLLHRNFTRERERDRERSRGGGGGGGSATVGITATTSSDAITGHATTTTATRRRYHQNNTKKKMSSHRKLSSRAGPKKSENSEAAAAAPPSLAGTSDPAAAAVMAIKFTASSSSSSGGVVVVGDYSKEPITLSTTVPSTVNVVKRSVSKEKSSRRRDGRRGGSTASDPASGAGGWLKTGPKPVGGVIASSSTAAAATAGAGQGSTKSCSHNRCGIRHSLSCLSTPRIGGSGHNQDAIAATANESAIALDELYAANSIAGGSARILSYLPQITDDFLLASRVSV